MLPSSYIIILSNKYQKIARITCCNTRITTAILLLELLARTEWDSFTTTKTDDKH